MRACCERDQKAIVVETRVKRTEKPRPDDIAEPSTSPSTFSHGVPSTPSCG